MVTACSGHRHPNDDLDSLLAAYRAENDRLAQGQEALRQQGIVKLDVEGSGEHARVSVDLVQARLDVVVETVLEGAEVSYVFEVPRLLGTTTAHFERRLLVEALRLLLGPRGIAATLEGGVMRIHPGSRESPLPEPGETAGRATTISLEVPLSWVSTERAFEVLDQMFPIDQDTGRRDVYFATRLETNSVFLSGPRQFVDGAVGLLQSLDTDPGHILLQALVIEFNTQSFLDLGSRIENGASGSISDFFFDVANLVGDTISFTRVADAANASSFSAVINLLVGMEQARLISRPYLSTRSGSPAHLEVAEDRFVVVETPGQIDVTLESISSGVVIDLLPIVTGDGTIVLEIEIDQSQFVPTLENVEQRRQRSTISTVAQVQPGQTVIIGGLMLKARAQSQAGVPWLRNIPPFSFIFGHEDYSHQESQLMIFVTPHLWEPGMETPLLETENFEIYTGAAEDTEVALPDEKQ